ncbi:MAG: lysophospholipid acyltransferase family protein [Cyanobacteria bacterium P01_H01_bin.74]
MARLLNNRLLKQALAIALGLPMKAFQATWRVKTITHHPAAKKILDSGQPVIFGLWHGRMYGLFKAVPFNQTAILVSPSNDGELIAQVARIVGFQHFIRGSHKRDRLQAALLLKDALVNQKLSVAFTVDGPRGPRYQVKPGIIKLAEKSQCPIIPLGISCSPLLKTIASSWDHFQIPMPFCRMALAYGEPLWISSTARENTEEKGSQSGNTLKTQLQNTLFDLHESLDQAFIKNDQRTFKSPLKKLIPMDEFESSDG